MLSLHVQDAYRSVRSLVVSSPNSSVDSAQQELYFWRHKCSDVGDQIQEAHSLAQDKKVCWGWRASTRLAFCLANVPAETCSRNWNGDFRIGTEAIAFIGQEKGLGECTKRMHRLRQEVGRTKERTWEKYQAFGLTVCTHLFFDNCLSFRSYFPHFFPQSSQFPGTSSLVIPQTKRDLSMKKILCTSLRGL